jgi:hypothetical protein
MQVSGGCCSSAKRVFCLRFDSAIVLMTSDGKHRDSRDIRRERGKQVIVVIQDESTKKPVKGILDKRNK